jgi:dihydropyrimidinase
MDLLIKNGKIVTPTETFIADVAVENGKIIAIGTDLSATEYRNVVDASGKYILPGAIDAHTHLAMPFWYTRCGMRWNNYSI